MLNPVHSSVVCLCLLFACLLCCADRASSACLIVSHSVYFQMTKLIQMQRATLIAELIARNSVECGWRAQ